MRKFSFSLPKKNFKLPKINNDTLTLGAIVAGAVGLWYFGINQSTRQFDLLGMLNMGGGAQQIPVSTPNMEGQLVDLEPIDVVTEMKPYQSAGPQPIPNPSNNPPMPVDTEESTLMIYGTAGAYSAKEMYRGQDLSNGNIQGGY